VRPVNLIPPEERRGERPPLRSGPLAYILVGALALALVAVTAVVFTGNQIKEREAEIASLEVREAEARARAQSLSAFAQFQSLSEARFATVSSLARSRFDWERVLRELALVIPDDVWLVELSGTASSEVNIAGGANVTLRAEVDGPALSLIGCGTGQEAVAGFIEALKDIDGVTRVGVASSELPASNLSSGSGGGNAADCRTRDFIAKFEIVAAFDAVEVEGASPSPDPGPQPAPPADGGDGRGGAEPPPAQQADGGGADIVSGVAR
jgi:Tfp pilus assembly protein PilN